MTKQAGDGTRTRSTSLEDSYANRLHHARGAVAIIGRDRAWAERGSQDSNLESPVLETGALANLATAPRESILVRAEGFEPPRAEAHQDLNLARLPDSATPAWSPGTTSVARAAKRFYDRG